ncbi:MAG: TIGR03751 family conjugal transfer lipoprotein [Gammaproteobacteria bacterium]|nr:TIGR03751 family conjugal transfer lipoprotein [Gammaproteobacteria bacterium]
MNTQKIALLIPCLISLVGCASTSFSGKIPNSGPTMANVYGQAMRQSSGASVEHVRRGVNPTGLYAGQRAVRQNPAEIVTYNQHFKLLPNPQVQMYVYPHLAGRRQVPVPGYTTQFPMFNSVHYADPSEMGSR